MANTLTAPATIKGGHVVTLDWQYNGLPGTAGRDTILYATSQLGEEYVCTYNDVYTISDVADGYVVTNLNAIPHTYFYVTRINGFDAAETQWRLDSWNSVDGNVELTGTSALDSIFTPYAPILTHATEGQALLIDQFQQSTDLKALLATYLDEVQELESSAYSLLNVREIDFASADRLDMIGEWVSVERGARTDEVYRTRIRAELAILKSRGTDEDLITVLQLLLGLDATTTLLKDEYFPKTVYMRATDRILTEDPVTIAELLRRTAAAGTELHFIHTANEADDENLFRFSDTPGASETSSSHGLDNGEFVSEVV